jgi:FlaA1/EpsC-like NDP-sugar epimerase
MRWRRLVVFAHDLAAVGVAWAAAFWLRFNLDLPADYAALMAGLLPWVLAIHAAAFWAFGLYRGLWRYASLPDLRRIVAATGLAALAVPALFTLLRAADDVPRSAYLLTPLLLAAMMSGSRLAYRAWREGQLTGLLARPRALPVLVLGAGAAAAALLKELGAKGEWRVVGLLDDDPGKQGGEILGVDILGPLDAAGAAARRMGVGHAIIAMPGASHAARRRALELCAAARLKVMTVPAISDIVAGRIRVSALRAIELDDLLGRDPVVLDEAGLRAFLGARTVLVTGAGGSIGAELCRQIARFAPSRLVLLDHSEAALHAVQQEFRDRVPGLPVAALIGDTADARRIDEVLARHRPEVIFHAAAYKHVPLMEEDNAFEAVANNVRSAAVLGRAAQRAGCRKFVLVSTDKAVNPANVMGASKRLAELACQALQTGGATEFVVVRFGNVLGSSGSVVPRFREQIDRGGPVTVTHAAVERYFMTIPEAAQLVLQAALMGRGGEIYVLDMGEPVKILDLARQMIRLSGLAESDIGIDITGLRPGEKMSEEPLAAEEQSLPTSHAKLRIARARSMENPALLEEVLLWLDAPGDTSADAVRARLRAWLPEYQRP